MKEGVKKFLYLLYTKYPDGRTHEKRAKEFIVSDKELNDLYEEGYIDKESTSEGNYYLLLPNALSLISILKSEEVNDKIHRLNILLVVLTIILLITGIATFIINLLNYLK